MDEKVYRQMGRTGVFDLVAGICTIAGGIACGVLLIIHGAKLLASRRNLLL